MEDHTIVSFFVKDLGLATVSKMYPDQSKASREVNDSLALSVGREKKMLFFFWTTRFQVLQGMLCTKFLAKIPRADCVGPILGGVQLLNMKMH